MTYEELFDAYRQVVSERDHLSFVGDLLWADLMRRGLAGVLTQHWESIRGIGNGPPLEEWAEC